MFVELLNQHIAIVDQEGGKIGFDSRDLDVPGCHWLMIGLLQYADMALAQLRLLTTMYDRA